MPIPKLVINISTPLILSLLAQSLYYIVAGIFVARIGETAIAAVSLAFPIQMLIIAVSVGTGIGINSLVSRKMGDKKHEDVGAIATTGLLLAVVSSFIFVIFGLFFVSRFLELYTDDPGLINMGVQYLRICTVFSLGIFVATTVQRLLQATGRTLLSMVSLITGVVVNIVLCPLLIYGYLGLPAMGVKGAAIATVIGQWAAAVLALILNLVRNKEAPFQIRGFRIDARMVGSIYRVGVPVMVSQALGSLMMALVNDILVSYSVTAVAFFGIYHRLQQFLYMPVNGLAQGLIPIVGYSYGAKRGKRIVAVGKFSGLLAVGIMAIGTLVFMLIPDQLLSLYSASEEMLALGVRALRIISVVFIPAGVIFVVGHMFTGMGNGMVNMVNTVLLQLLTLAIMSLAARYSGVNRIWYAFWISHAVALVYSILCVRRAYHRVMRMLVAT